MKLSPSLPFIVVAFIVIYCNLFIDIEHCCSVEPPPFAPMMEIGCVDFIGLVYFIMIIIITQIKM